MDAKTRAIFTRLIVAVGLALGAVAWLSPKPAAAAMVTTAKVVEEAAGLPQGPEAGGTEARIDAARQRLGELLAREEAVSQLEALGVAPDEARARVESLTDEEVLQIAGKLDALPAGEGPVGLLVVVLLIVLLVVLLV
ncbi:MAG: PA2779 family protein [Rhodospirillales bacterium]|nr:PA2779 family protein [Rhodospirillales bacterium]